MPYFYETINCDAKQSFMTSIQLTTYKFRFYTLPPCLRRNLDSVEIKFAILNVRGLRNQSKFSIKHTVLKGV